MPYEFYRPESLQSIRFVRQGEKTKKKSYWSSIERSSNVTIQADVCGPMWTPTIGGDLYLLILITVHQRFVQVPLLKSRAEVGEYLYEYIEYIDRKLRQ